MEVSGSDSTAPCKLAGPVTVPCVCFTVHQAGEYATVFLRAWETTRANSRAMFGGELVVHSSFGTYGYTWPSCGKPFLQFIASISYDSLIGKCFGADAWRYDGAATFLEVVRALLRLRRDDDVGPSEARELWSEWWDRKSVVEHSLEGFYLTAAELCGDVDSAGDALFTERAQYECRKPNPQAVGFWNVLWPSIRAAIVEQIQPDSEKPQ